MSILAMMALTGIMDFRCYSSQLGRPRFNVRDRRERAGADRAKHIHAGLRPGWRGEGEVIAWYPL